MSVEFADLPNVDATLLRAPDPAALRPAAHSTHAPRILLLYGSLRERSFSRLVTLEAQRLLIAMGAETRVFDPAGLPLPAREGAKAVEASGDGRDEAALAAHIGGHGAEQWRGGLVGPVRAPEPLYCRSGAPALRAAGA